MKKMNDKPAEKCYLFHFSDDSLYEMTCGISFKDALWEMSKYTGQSSELLCKCLKSFDSDDVKGIIDLFHHFSDKTIEDVYIVDKKIY